MSPTAYLRVACVAAIASLSACGSSTGESKPVFPAAKKGELQRKVERLEGKLNRRRAVLRTEAARARRRVARSAAQEREATAGGAGFDRLEAELGGEVGVTIGAPGSSPALVLGSLASGSAWSTSKVPIALRLLQDVGGPSGLSPAQEEEMRRALTLSDNGAAAALFADLEKMHGGVAGAAAAVDEVLHEAGDASTEISAQGRDGFSPYGQTVWSLASQGLFMARLAAGCIGSPESSQHVLGLMGDVSSDTWGLGLAGLPARWKGGWGPGVDGRYLVRQMGTLEVGGEAAVVTLAAIADSGDFEAAQTMATALARWLADRAADFAGAADAC